MPFIPRIERSIEIHAPVKNVFNILDDAKLGIKWNLPISEISEITEGTYIVKSNLGEFSSSRIESIKNEKISVEIKGGIFSNMGYVLITKGELTEVMLWGEFEDVKREKVLVRAAEMLLEGLKSFAEFLEKGGNLDDFDKKQISVDH